jgi:hypothetical protein
LDENQYHDVLKKIDQWTISLSITPSSGLYWHIREILYSLMLHREKARRSHILISQSAHVSNENWVTVNCEFNNACVALCASYDLCGHLYSVILNPDEPNIGDKRGRKWDDGKWDYYITNKNDLEVNYDKCKALISNSTNIPSNMTLTIHPVPMLNWTLNDAVKYLRHKPIHGTYDYVVGRRDSPSEPKKWILVDPQLDFHTVCLLRDEVMDKCTNKHNCDAWNKIPINRFVIDGSVPFDVMQVLEHLMCHSLTVQEKVLKVAQWL